MTYLSIINPELFKSWELYVFLGFGATLFLKPKWFLLFFRFSKKIFMPQIRESYPDWTKSPKGANYLAQDDDGIWRWHNRKPKLINGKWVSNEFAAMNMAGYTKASDFTNSLQKKSE